MKPNVMISYSRQQSPFVDAFYKDLVKAGYDVWLDYHRLIPSEPWQDQITAGVKSADTILLVVSKDSMQSDNVTYEWSTALKDGKRVILVLFEATPIENEKLKKCESVDFRGNYKAGLQQLDALLKSEPLPLDQRPRVPESGFKAPFMFWIALAISLLLVVASIPVIWTVFIPFILIPLPLRILQRNYNFSQVAPTLFLMPFLTMISDVLLRTEGNIFSLLPGSFFTVGWIGAGLAWVLLGLFFTSAMRLRARPEAVPARVNRTRIMEEVEQRSVRFFIDHAPEDARYAKDLRRALEKHDHVYVEDGKDPQAVFILLSAYKNETKYKAGRGVSLFPVVLQKPENIDGELSKIQWLDFRRGMKNLDKIAKLLPEPAKLVKVLAVPPTSKQEVFPLAVNVLQFFYLTTGVLGGGGLLITVLSLLWLQATSHPEVSLLPQIMTGIVNGLLLFGAVFYTVKAVRTRSGGMAAVYPLMVLTVLQATIHVFSFVVLAFNSGAEIGSAFDKLVSSASNTNGFAAMGYLIGLVLILPFLLFGWRDFYRWLPTRTPGHLSKLESVLLLYSPDSFLKLILHVLFHTLILLLFYAEGFLTVKGSVSANITPVLCIVIPVTALAFFIHWLATRKPKAAV